MKTMLDRPAAAAALLLLASGCSQAAAPGAIPGNGPLPMAQRLGAHAVRAAAGNALLWTQTDAYKVRPADKPVTANTTANVSGARGETASFQIVVTAKSSALSNVNVAMSDLSDGHGHTLAAAGNVALFREFYVDLTHPSGSQGHTGYYPDALIPIGKDAYYHETRNGAPFTVPANNNQAVWADVEIPASASPGTYKGTATVTQGSTTLGSIPVTLTVWNFTLPATSSLTTAFGFNSWVAYVAHYGSHWNTDKIVALTKLYYAEGLKHRISYYGGDVADPSYSYNAATHKIASIDYSLYDETQDPNLDGTLIPNGAKGTVADLPNAAVTAPGPTPGPNDAQYVAFEKVMSKYFEQKGWYARNFYYDYDEPQTATDFATVAHRADVIHQADPNLRVMDTTTLRSDLIGKVNIWTPIVNALDFPGNPPPSAYTARQKAGDKVWFYTSNNSLNSYGPWPNFFIDAGMNDARIFSWMAWRYHLDGFLYYSVVNNYEDSSNPWLNVYSFGDNGDGTLFYPGKVSIIGGQHDIPCPSIRLKTIRAALQDYEYMQILHTMGQDAFVNSIVGKLVVKTNNWSHDPQALEDARTAMAAKIAGGAAVRHRIKGR